MSDLSEYFYNHPDVKYINLNGRQYIIVGTAHISNESAKLVHDIIENEKPDTVCVELDQKRFDALSDHKRWESTDLKELIKKKQLTTLLINIVLASYQKKLGLKLGTAPGIELIEAVKTAMKNNINVALCDRDIRITLQRTWKSMPFFQKVKLLSASLATIFDKEEITEEKMKEIRNKDVLSELFTELGSRMPVLKKVLIDERDIYISQKILAAEGQKIISVVGAGHVEGIVKQLCESKPQEIAVLEEVPISNSFIKYVGWVIPIMIISSIVYIGATKGISTASENLLSWILINGIPSAVGAIFALAHPLTILSSFLAAPFTALSPLIGVGYVASFIQALNSPPKVKEFSSVTDDINKVKLWWQNKLLRVLLVFIFTGIGGVIGTYFATYQIIQNVLN